MRRRAFLATIGALASRPALAQFWPTQPIRLIVPYAAGGPTDVAARLLAEALSASLPQRVVVENRTGAGTVVGTGAVASGPRDGHSFLIATVAHVVNPVLVPNLPFDPIADFRAFAAHRARGGVLDEGGMVAFLTEVIRRKAGTDPTVGPHVMSVVLHHPLTARRAVCCFDPLEGRFGEMEVDGVKARLPVAYSPWILTSHTYCSPTEASGTPGESAFWKADGWTFEMRDVPRAAAAPANVGWAVPQRRKPNPALAPRRRR